MTKIFTESAQENQYYGQLLYKDRETLHVEGYTVWVTVYADT